MILADCGTTYVKILDTGSNQHQIVKTTDFLRKKPERFDAATGHLGRMTTDFYQNELICLARGAQELIGSDSFCVIDVGGRDTKLVEFKNGKPVKLDWNTSCGANTGFTLEIVGKYYGVDYKILDPENEFVNVTCGVFGIERVFDSIIDGLPPERAVARFVHGVARNVHRAVDRKEKFYLSGGLVENECFLKTLETYAEVVTLGRMVLLEGLKICLGN